MPHQIDPRDRFFRNATGVLRHTLIALCCMLFFGNCAGNGCEGCASLGNPDYKFPKQRLITGVIEARVTSSGITFITDNLKTLIGVFFKVDANGVAEIPLAQLGLGKIDVIDFGLLSVSLRDLVITLDFSSLSVELVENSSPAQIRIRIDNATIGLKGGVVSADFLFSVGDAACRLENGIDVGKPTARITRVSLDMLLNITVDSEKKVHVSTETNAINLQDMGVTLKTDCNLGECNDGLPPKCGECQTLCPLSNFGASIASGLQQLLKNQINSLFQAFGDWLIKQILDQLINDKPLEIQGELSLASVLAGFLPNAKRMNPIGFLISPGANGLIVNGSGTTLGLDLKLDGGVDTEKVHSCIASPKGEPLFTAGPPPFLDGTEIDSSGNPFSYHFGMALSSAFLNQAVWAAYKSGLLCITLSTDDVFRISGGQVTLTAAAFDLILPGFREISSTKSPMFMEIHPKIGHTEFPVLTLLPDKNLLRLRLVNSGVSLFTIVENRWARLVQVDADIDITLGLVVKPGNQIEISLGKLDITNLNERYNELFKNADVEAMVEFVLDLALTYLLKNGFTLDLNIDQLLSTVLTLPVSATLHELRVDGKEKDWLSLFVSLKQSGASGLQFAPQLTATPGSTQELFQLQADGSRKPTGQITLTVKPPAGVRAALEYQVRVNGGLWRSWSDQPKLVVRSPHLKLQGKHMVELRGRLKGEINSLQLTPTQISIWVDAAAPRLSITRLGATLQFHGADDVAPAESLRYSYRTEHSNWSPFSASTVVAVATLPAGSQELQVRAVDPAGNLSAIATVTLTSQPDALAPVRPGGGCQQTLPARNGGTALLLWLFLTVGLWWRRRTL